MIEVVYQKATHAVVRAALFLLKEYLSIIRGLVMNIFMIGECIFCMDVQSPRITKILKRMPEDTTTPEKPPSV